MWRLSTLNLMQKGFTHQIFCKENPLVFGKTIGTVSQKRLKSDVYRISNNLKLSLISPLKNEWVKKECKRGVKNCIGNKNFEMWNEYRFIDPRVIRPVDSNEYFVLNFYVSVSDVFPKISTEEFKRRAQENLSKLEIFNIALKRINNHYFFIRKPFKIHVEEVEYNESEEMDYYLKNEDDIVIPFESFQEKDDTDVRYLFKFKICQLKKSNQTKITITASHVICDGRSLFNVRECIQKIVIGEILETNNDKVANFGGRERFKNLDKSFDHPPKVWDEIRELPILPKLNPPFEYVTSHKIFNYRPISEFIKKTGISVQSMLMVMLTRATRRYKNLPKDSSLWNGVACDVRDSPYATEEFKKRKFYHNASGFYVKLNGQSTLMDDLEYCKIQLKEAKKSNTDIQQMISCISVIDPITFEYVPNGNYPGAHTHAIVKSTNLGRVNGNFPLFFLSYDPMADYNFYVHSYHTDDKLFISTFRPINFDRSYLNYINEEMNKIFIPENIFKN